MQHILPKQDTSQPASIEHLSSVLKPLASKLLPTLFKYSLQL